MTQNQSKSRTRAAWLTSLVVLCAVAKAVADPGYQAEGHQDFGATQYLRWITTPDGKYAFALGNQASTFEHDAINGGVDFRSRIYPNDTNSGIYQPIAAQVSPDGKFLYLLSESEETLSTYAINASDGALSPVQVLKREKSLFWLLDNFTDMAISPDGKHVIVTNNRTLGAHVFSRDPVSGQLTFLKSYLTQGQVLFVPGTNFVYFQFGNVDIFERDPAIGSLTRVGQFVPDPATLGGFSSSAISNDGSYFYASSVKDHQVHALSIDQGTGALTHLQSLVRSDPDAANSPAGPIYLAFSNPDDYLYAYHPSKTGIEAFSRDSVNGMLTSIQFTNLDQAPLNLFSHPVDNALYAGKTSLLRYPINPTTGMIGASEAIGDGDFVVPGTFVSLEFSADSDDVYISGNGGLTLGSQMPDGKIGDPVAVDLSFFGGSAPASSRLTPDENYLFLELGDKLGVMSRDPVTGALTATDQVDHDGEVSQSFRVLAFHPDGSRLLWKSKQDSESKILSLDPVTGALTLLSELSIFDPYQAFFSQDGKFLLTRRSDTYSIYAFDDIANTITLAHTYSRLDFSGLNFGASLHPSHDRRYIFAAGSSSIQTLEFDPVTGELAQVASFNPTTGWPRSETKPRALVPDPAIDRLYLDATPYPMVVDYDQDTAAMSVLDLITDGTAANIVLDDGTVYSKGQGLTRLSLLPDGDLVIDQPPEQVTPADGSLALDLSAYVQAKVGAITYEAVGFMPGYTVDAVTGMLTGRPASNVVTEHQFSVFRTGKINVVDEAGNRDSLLVHYNLQNYNPAPILIHEQGDRFVDEDLSLSSSSEEDFPCIICQFVDLRGEFLTFVAEGLPASLQSANGFINGNAKPTNDDALNSPFTITVTATDEVGQTVQSTFDLHVRNTNDPPDLLATIPRGFAIVDEFFSYDVSPYFKDPELDTIRFELVNDEGWLSVDANTGVLSGTPNAIDKANNINGQDVELRAYDSEDLFTEVTVNLRIEDQGTPFITVNGPLPKFVFTEDTFASFNISSYITESGGNPLTYFLNTFGGDDRIPDGIEFTANGRLRGTPPNSAIGFYEPRLSVSNGQPWGTVIVDFDIEVLDQSDPVQQLQAIPNAQISEDGGSFNLNLHDYFTDQDGDPLVFTVTGLPTGYTIDNGSISGGASDTVAKGSPYNVEVTVTDVDNNVLMDSFVLTVIDVHHAPTIQLARQLHGGTGLPGDVVSQGTWLYFGDADETEVLTYSATDLPPSLNIDPATALITGTLNIADAQGSPYNTVVTATDPQGLSVGRAATYIIAEQDIPPVKDSDPEPLLVFENQATQFTLIEHFSDSVGDILSINNLVMPAGILNLNGGTYTYTADEGTASPTPYTVNFNVYDAYGNNLAASFEVTIVDDAFTNLEVQGEPRGIPDMNFDGAGDFGLIFKDLADKSKRLLVFDGVTGDNLFNASLGRITMYDYRAIEDLNADGVPEIAVLARVGANLRLLVVDLANDVELTNVSLGRRGKGYDLVTVDDVDANGVEEIGALWRNKDKHVRLDVYDPLTGFIIYSRRISRSGSGANLAALDDMNANGSEEIVVLWRTSTTRPRLDIRDSMTGSRLDRGAAGPRRATPNGLFVFDDWNVDGKQEIVAFAEVSRRNAHRFTTEFDADESPTELGFLFDPDRYTSVARIDQDVSGDGINETVFLVENADNTSRVDLVTGNGATVFRTFNTGITSDQKPSFTVIPDVDGDGVDDILIIQTDNTGRAKATVYSAMKDSLLDTYSIPY